MTEKYLFKICRHCNVDIPVEVGRTTLREHERVCHPDYHPVEIISSRDYFPIDKKQIVVEKIKDRKGLVTRINIH